MELEDLPQPLVSLLVQLVVLLVLLPFLRYLPGRTFEPVVFDSVQVVRHEKVWLVPGLVFDFAE